MGEQICRRAGIWAVLVCMYVGIAHLLAALREIPEAFPGCRTRTGASSAFQGLVVDNDGLLDGQCWANR